MKVQILLFINNSVNSNHVMARCVRRQTTSLIVQRSPGRELNAVCTAGNYNGMSIQWECRGNTNGHRLVLNI